MKTNYMINKKALVTIVIPCYNHESYVQKAIQSVIDQDYDNIEFIIIDDGSKDNSVAKIEEMIPACQKRFRRFEFRHRINKGLPKTLNEGLKWAKGDFFSPVASDDILLNHKVTTLLNAWNKNKNLEVIFGDANFIDMQANKIKLNIKNSVKVYNMDVDNFLLYHTINRFDYRDKKKFGSYETILENNYLPAMSCIIKTESLVNEGGWDSNYNIEDWQMWLSLSKKSQFFLVDEVVSSYRIHGKNSFDLIGDKLNYDAYFLLASQKNYAISNGYKDIFYRNLAKRIYSLKKISRVIFFKEFLFNLNSSSFIKNISFDLALRVLKKYK